MTIFDPVTGQLVVIEIKPKLPIVSFDTAPPTQGAAQRRRNSSDASLSVRPVAATSISTDITPTISNQ
jgi:hypothetical protein